LSAFDDERRLFAPLPHGGEGVPDVAVVEFSE
jgi:hypothetical protein